MTSCAPTGHPIVSRVGERKMARNGGLRNDGWETTMLTLGKMRLASPNAVLSARPKVAITV